MLFLSVYFFDAMPIFTFHFRFRPPLFARPARALPCRCYAMMFSIRYAYFHISFFASLMFFDYLFFSYFMRATLLLFCHFFAAAIDADYFAIFR